MEVLHDIRKQVYSFFWSKNPNMTTEFSFGKKGKIILEWSSSFFVLFGFLTFQVVHFAGC